jgi:hypothetical protein
MALKRKPTEEQAVLIAKTIVESWESIDATATKLALELPNANSGMELKRTIVRSLQSMVGGREVYEAAKSYLAARSN